MLGEIVAGSGLGALVGMLLGLSVSHVVGSVIGALAALLGAFLGLRGDGPAGRSWRIGAFGLACLIAVLAGISVRAHALLAPSVRDDVAAWTRAGFPADEARAYVALARLGVKPAQRDVIATPAPSAASDALFAGPTAGLCARLATMPATVKLRLLHGAGPPYTAIAATAEAAADPTKALAAGMEALCGG